jgi:hypothetical protein
MFELHCQLKSAGSAYIPALITASSAPPAITAGYYPAGVGSWGRLGRAATIRVEATGR